MWARQWGAPCQSCLGRMAGSGTSQGIVKGTVPSPPWQDGWSWSRHRPGVGVEVPRAPCSSCLGGTARSGTGQRGPRMCDSGTTLTGQLKLGQG